MNAIAPKAIQTEYKGYLFRSRLEARWAVFFETLGVKWRYETEGYEAWEYEDGESNGKPCEVVKKCHRYLPDFFLPDFGCFVEVKGDPKGLWMDRIKLWAILKHESSLPGFDNLSAVKTYGFTGLVVLGDVPNVTWGSVYHPVLVQNYAGIERRWCFFNGPYLRMANAYDVEWVHCITGTRIETEIFCPDNNGAADDASDDVYRIDPVFVPLQLASKVVVEAYQSARAARFEHGGRAYHR